MTSVNSIAAKLVVHDKIKKANITEVAFSFNPEAIRITKTVKPKQQRQAGKNAPKLQFTTGDETKIEFGEIVFDTFDERLSVYKQHVKFLEALITVDPDTHRPPRVHFQWGTAKYEDSGENNRLFYVTALDVNYIMFLPDGTPVRAKVKLTLTEVPDPAGEERNGPGTAHVHLVTRGDSLQAIASEEYNDPAEWRRIAVANGIDDPLDLVPGRRLLIPPILR